MNLKTMSPGEKVPDEFIMVIEIPKGSSIKYEITEEGAIAVDRILYHSMFYPIEYGFIPSTKYLDGDPVDVCLLMTYTTMPGTVIKARPIGMLKMRDEAGIDNKIIAVPIKKVDPRFADVNDISDLPEHTLKEIELFFADYKKLEGEKYKSVKVEGFEGKESAKKIILESIKAYKG